MHVNFMHCAESNIGSGRIYFIKTANAIDLTATFEVTGSEVSPSIYRHRLFSSLVLASGPHGLHTGHLFT